MVIDVVNVLIIVDASL